MFYIYKPRNKDNRECEYWKSPYPKRNQYKLITFYTSERKNSNQKPK